MRACVRARVRVCVQRQTLEKAVADIVNASIDSENKLIFRELGAVRLLVALLHEQDRNGGRAAATTCTAAAVATTPAAQQAAADALCNLMHNNAENQVQSLQCARVCTSI